MQEAFRLFRSFSTVKAATEQRANMQIPAQVLHSNSSLSKSTEVLTAKCTLNTYFRFLPTV